jgi:hypothetical protein
MDPPIASVPRSARRAAQDIQLRSDWFEPSMHSAYFQILSRLLATRSKAAPRAFSGQPRLLPLLDCLPLLDAVDALGDPQGGAKIGCAVPAAAHGPMGLAALASNNIRHAMETVARYTPVRNRLFRYRCYSADASVVLALPSRLSLGGYARFLQIGTLYALFNIFRVTADEWALSQATVCLPWPEPTMPD